MKKNQPDDKQLFVMELIVTENIMLSHLGINAATTTITTAAAPKLLDMFRLEIHFVVKCVKWNALFVRTEIDRSMKFLSKSIHWSKFREKHVPKTVWYKLDQNSESLVVFIHIFVCVYLFKIQIGWFSFCSACGSGCAYVRAHIVIGKINK